MKSFKILLLLLVPLLLSASLHKFYVSTTKVEYVKEVKSLQIISKIFIDDMEDLLQTRYDVNVSLATDKERKIDEEYLKKYLLQKVKIKLDGKEVSLKYIGREYENDVIKVFLEVQPINDFSIIEIENKVLFELSKEQQNIIHVKYQKQRKSMLLDSENPNALLNFN